MCKKWVVIFFKAVNTLGNDFGRTERKEKIANGVSKIKWEEVMEKCKSGKFKQTSQWTSDEERKKEDNERRKGKKKRKTSHVARCIVVSLPRYSDYYLYFICFLIYKLIIALFLFYFYFSFTFSFTGLRLFNFFCIFHLLFNLYFNYYF